MDVDKYLSLDCGRAVRPAPGHRAGGDSAVIVEHEHYVFLAIVDVLGHGLEASALATDTTVFLREHACQDVVGLMNRLHQHLIGSRGACAGLCVIERDSGHTHYCAVGNTVARCFGSNEIRLVSRDGVLGSEHRTAHDQTFALARGDVLVLYSDGVRSHFELSEYPLLLSDKARIITSTIIDRFGKDHDDSSCIAARRG